MLTADELMAKNPDVSIESKNILIELWADDVWHRTGKHPASYELQKLADWLLAAELKDKSRTKVQKYEYPILSKPQLERRYREMSMEAEMVDVLHKRKLNNHPTRKKDAKNNDY
ncbi:hypothetical protein NX029_26245 [Cytobacillus firmus]|nr:hypothetical protein [Cytobacillus firmus]